MHERPLLCPIIIEGEKVEILGADMCLCSPVPESVFNFDHAPGIILRDADSNMTKVVILFMRLFFVPYIALSTAVQAAEEKPLKAYDNVKRVAYKKGDLLPVTCLNRTL